MSFQNEPLFLFFDKKRNRKVKGSDQVLVKKLDFLHQIGAGPK